MKILAKCIHGSKLYGLDGPSSDTDWKAIYQPSLNDLVLMKAVKNETKKLSDKEEYEGFALQAFLGFASNAEDVAVTLLHASERHVVIDSEIYKFLRNNKHRFYSKKMTGSLGYARGQVFKYALRAERKKAVSNFISILKDAASMGKQKMLEIFDDLPLGEYYSMGVEDKNKMEDKRYFSCAGKKVLPSTSILYAIEIFEALLSTYGDRVSKAASLDGKDYKSISHAFRCAYQLRSIYVYGGFEYPLKETQFIKDVKFGIIPFIEGNLDSKLDNLIQEVEHLAENSSYPEKVDSNFVDKVILDAYSL